MFGKVFRSAPLFPSVLLPDVLGQDRELLELAQHVAGRSLVVDDQRVRVGRLGVLDVRDQPRCVRRAAALVLDVRVDRPGRIVGGQRLAVRPLRAVDRLERPRLPIRRGRPRLREIRGELLIRLVVLDEERVDVHEGVVGVLVERDIRVQRVDSRARAHAERAALLPARARSTACEEDRQRNSAAAQLFLISASLGVTP